MWALILMSAGPMCIYLVIWMGWIKSWYILLPLPGRFKSSSVYALLPLGLAFTMLLIAATFFPAEIRTRPDIWSILFFLFGAVGLLFTIWCPPWIKPAWVRWLEREYGYGLPILLEEARAMGRWKWEVRVSTREGLEGWVQEVLRTREADMYKAWRGWISRQVGRNIDRMRKTHKRSIPLDQYLAMYEIPFMPEHRKEDYRQYMMNPRQRILRTHIESLDSGQTFVVSDLEQVCPDLPRKRIRFVLDELRAQGYIRCTGRGRLARWQRM